MVQACWIKDYQTLPWPLESWKRIDDVPYLCCSSTQEEEAVCRNCTCAYLVASTICRILIGKASIKVRSFGEISKFLHEDSSTASSSTQNIMVKNTLLVEIKQMRPKLFFSFSEDLSWLRGRLSVNKPHQKIAKVGTGRCIGPV
jgi:hypothetical protein